MIKFRVSKNHAVWRMVCRRQEKEQGSEGRRVVRGGEQRGAAEGGQGAGPSQPAGGERDN